jgi:DNA ligase-1
MKNVLNIINELSGTSSRNEKKEILLRVMETSDVFCRGFMMSVDKMTAYGIKSIPKYKGSNDSSLDFEDFLFTVRRLEERALSGNRAKESVVGLMKRSNEDEWNLFYRPILSKGFKLGVTEKSWNDVARASGHDEYVVPVFACQLATDGKDMSLSGTKIVDMKLDGVRTVAVVNESGAKLFSRSGKLFENFASVEDQLYELWSKYCKVPMVFDGEMVLEGGDFQSLMKQVQRKDDVKTENSRFVIFDMLPFDKFVEGEYPLELSERKYYLDKVFMDAYSGGTDHPNVTRLSYDIVKDQDLARAIPILRKKAATEGYEGIMVKDFNSPYKCKRTKDWLKIKPVISLTLTIVGVEAGKEGQFSDTTGSLVVEGIDEGKRIRVNVGSGLKPEDRDYFWNNRLLVTNNMLVEVEADAITKSESSDTYSLRFPRFKGIRSDIDGIKI